VLRGRVTFRERVLPRLQPVAFAHPENNLDVLHPKFEFEGLELCTLLELVGGLVHQQHPDVQHKVAHDSEEEAARQKEANCATPVLLNQVQKSKFGDQTLLPKRYACEETARAEVDLVKHVELVV